LRELFDEESTFISEISRVEVLGYHKLKSDEESYFKSIFRFVPIIFPSPEIYDAAIEIRKKHNLKLGDSIIAATALVHGLTIYSRNLKDFEKVSTIKCINPVR
jgi:predicted nucleic acid-binding protein